MFIIEEVIFCYESSHLHFQLSIFYICALMEGFLRYIILNKYIFISIKVQGGDYLLSSSCGLGKTYTANKQNKINCINNRIYN